MLRVLGLILLVLLAVPATYLVAMIVLGLIPVNAGWREADEGVVIFIQSNGRHTGIGMPIRNDQMDWTPLVPPEHLRQPIAADYVFVGYGHRDFYLNTPSWAELSLATAFDAAFGDGPALLQVEHVVAPVENPAQKAITLRPDEYRRLVAYIEPRFRRDAEGRTLPLLGRGYGDHDMFYEANGGFNFWFNCNEWAARALRAAGVRMGLWTPWPQAIMWRLD